MNALIPLLGSKKKATTLLKDYLNLPDPAAGDDIATFLQTLDERLYILEESALSAASPAEQAEAVIQVARLALVKSSIRTMSGKVDFDLISDMLTYGLFTQTQAVQTAAQQKVDSFIYLALMDLAPLLDADHLQAAIDVANGLNDDFRRPYALAYLVIQLDDDRRREWVNTLFEETPSPLDGQKYVDVYLPLLPHLSPAQRADLIPQILQITTRRTTVRIGMALLPVLNWLSDAPVPLLYAPLAELTKKRFPQQVNNLPDERETSPAVWQAFVLTLSMQDMIDGIQRSSFRETEYHLLTDHLNRLPAESRSAWFTLALETAQALTRADKLWHKAIVLALLADWAGPHNLLPADQREALLTEAQELAWATKDTTDRSVALLMHIAPCLPPEQQLPLVQQALKKMGMPRWAKEARALKAALPLLPEAEALKWLGKVLKKAGKLKDEAERYAACTVLNPAEATVEAKWLDSLVKQWQTAARDSDDDLILTQVLPHLSPTERTPWLDKLWTQTNQEKWPRARALGLRQLLPLLPADKQAEALALLTETALGLSKQAEIVSIAAEVGKPDELSRLVGLVPAEQKDTVVNAALKSMLAMNDSWRRSATSSMYALDYFLGQLARMIPHLEPEQAADIWPKAEAHLSTQDTWPVAALLYPCLPPAQATEVKNKLTAILTAPLTVTEGPLVYGLISAIVLSRDILSQSQWATALQEAERLTSLLEKPVFRARAWFKLLPHFSGEARYLALRETLNTLEAIPDVSYRQQELFDLIPQLTAQTITQEAFVCVRLLRIAANLNRVELLEALRHLSPLLTQLEARPDVAQSVAKIGDYFS